MSRNDGENQLYAERALWAVLVPAAVLGPARGARADLPRRQVRVREPVRPGMPGWVPVSELTASLLGRLIGDLTSGPLFLDGAVRLTRERAFSMARSRAEINPHAFRSGGLSARFPQAVGKSGARSAADRARWT